jgi:hypothetical protein
MRFFVSPQAAVTMVMLWLSFGLEAAVTVTPASPTSADVITIRLATEFSSDGRVTSATISRVGNTFVIQQNVGVSCMNPNGFTAISEFQVGPLPPGTYDVTASIVPSVLCSPPALIHEATFTVAAANIPTLSDGWLLLLFVTLAAVAAAVIAPRT